MQSVGEVMAIGRTFPESLQKALRGLELGPGRAELPIRPRRATTGSTTTSSLERAAMRDARTARSSSRRRCGAASASSSVAEATGDRPVVPRPDRRHRRRAARARRPRRAAGSTPSRPRRWADWRRAKRLGFSDAQIAYLFGVAEAEVRAAQARAPACARPSRPSTPAAPSSPPRRRITTRPTRTRTRSGPAASPRVVILGSGPNRIGQGIEFDYCCVHASMALRDGRLRDRDGQLQPGDRLDRLRHLRPPLLRADHRGGRPRRHRGRDERRRRRRRRRDRRARRPDAAQARRPAPARARARHEPGRDRHGRGPRAVVGALRRASRSRNRPAAPPPRWTRRSRSSERIGYPALVRPSYVLGGRAMEIVYDDEDSRSGRRRLSLGARGPAGGRCARCSSTGSSRTRSRSTSTPSATSPARC